MGFDYEYDSITYAQKHGVNPSNTLIDSMARAFWDAMRADGWFVNLYTNSDFIRSGRFSAATMKQYDVWLADYAGAPDYLCSIQQTGSAGVVPGITGAVDTDVCFKDYPTIIRTGGYNGYPKPKAPVFKCDTTTDVTLARGQAYQFKVTSKVAQTASVGTQGVVTLRQRRKVGNDTYYSIVGIGRPGAAAGAYVGGVKQFIVHIKQK
nr:hypothetical protein [uncultured Caproiciproducens sp.]